MIFRPFGEKKIKKKLDMENDPRWPPPTVMEFSINIFFLNPSLKYFTINNHSQEITWFDIDKNKNIEKKTNLFLHGYY